ncbi:MAG: OsmC family protein [Cyclobacteriaceae bacterium]
MKREVSIDWKGGMEFLGDLDGHKVVIDADAENGGTNKGSRPKPFMLLSLAGCTGMDVVFMLKKMKVEFDGLSISVEGELMDELPKAFTSMRVIYHFKGKNLPLEKLEKAVNLSSEKYCGVSATLKQVIPITYEIRIEES